MTFQVKVTEVTEKGVEEKGCVKVNPLTTMEELEKIIEQLCDGKKVLFAHHQFQNGQEMTTQLSGYFSPDDKMEDIAFIKGVDLRIQKCFDNLTHLG